MKNPSSAHLHNIIQSRYQRVINVTPGQDSCKLALVCTLINFHRHKVSMSSALNLSKIIPATSVYNELTAEDGVFKQMSLGLIPGKSAKGMCHQFCYCFQ